MSTITILKFGSSVLRTEGDLPRAVHEIYRAWRGGEQVLAVVSAFGDITSRNTAAALLGLALDRSGIPFRVLDPAQTGLRMKGGGSDVELVAADVAHLRAELRRGVVVLPGFVGRDEGGNTRLLGRGGSDLTALLLAHCLGGRCVLFKDTEGLYSGDPAQPWSRRFAQASWKTACAVSGEVVQQRAIRSAESQALCFTITALGATASTEVCAGPDLLATAEMTPSPPLRVALLGCGTVGGGVYEHLAALPELFTVTGVARNIARAAQIPIHLLTVEPEELIERRCDVVVELIGGVERAGQLIRQALRLRRHVVTANKALVATEGAQLEALASEAGVLLRNSAAVGGALPAIETVARLRAGGSIKAFSGVLNGTTNFVLDRLADGDDFEGAVRAAQAAGYAEADPSLDLDGTDAAQKLVILARSAFGARLEVSAVRREGIVRVDCERVRTARADGFAVRLVASCSRTAKGLEASVTPTELPVAHPLALTTGAENSLLVEQDVGAPHFVSARGAGRWPTAEAVLADLFDVRREVIGGAVLQSKPIVWKKSSGLQRTGLSGR